MCLVDEIGEPKPAEEPEPQPTLLRLELGALGFAERCVLLVLRPGAGLWHPWAALTTVANHLKENPGDRLVAVGHRESAEPEEHGRLRATALVHFIKGEREAWLAIAAKWGHARDTQEYLAYLRHARGWPLPTVLITDEADDATASVVVAFQQVYNARPECVAAIFEDGVIGEQTLGAIFDTARTCGRPAHAGVERPRPIRRGAEFDASRRVETTIPHPLGIPRNYRRPARRAGLRSPLSNRMLAIIVLPISIR